MKRLFPFFICLSLILSFTPITAAAAVPWPTGVSIEADGGILMDADTGSILYGKMKIRPIIRPVSPKSSQR